MALSDLQVCELYEVQSFWLTMWKPVMFLAIMDVTEHRLIEPASLQFSTVWLDTQCVRAASVLRSVPVQL